MVFAHLPTASTQSLAASAGASVTITYVGMSTNMIIAAERLTMHHSTAFSTSASSKTRRADLPPSSMVVGMPLLAAQAFTFLPLVTLPVKATLANRGSELQFTVRTKVYTVKSKLHFA